MYQINHTSTHVHVAFESSHHRVLSSAVLNGGWVAADHIVNMKVPENFQGKQAHFVSPEVTLANYAHSLHLEGRIVGMMTAASMNSFRQVTLIDQGAEVIALVTAGVSNAKRAGEPAEWRKIESRSHATGTINIIILTNAFLSQAAMVEAVMIATEAKAAALADLDIKSPQTGRQATGTGTDAVAVVSGFGPLQVRYCGKHVLFGEMLAAATIRAITQSLSWGR